MVSTQNLTSAPLCPHGKPTIRHSGSPSLRSRPLKSRWTRWTRRPVIFPPRPEGVRDVPGRPHSIPRTLSLRNIEARTALSTINQEPHETVSQFTIRFQDLYRQLTQNVSAHHITDTFLAGLREALRTTLALTYFSQQTIGQVIARVLTIEIT